MIEKWGFSTLIWSARQLLQVQLYQRPLTHVMQTYRLTGIHCKFTRFMATHRSTIFALSSGHGKCGVAVIRVSGVQAKSVLQKLGRFVQPPVPRKAILRKLVNPTSGALLDKALLLWLPGPGSFTGEDSCELHVHGGPAVVTSVLGTLGQIPAVRPAEPGEFTKRAFENGKLDLTEVEGLADLIHAETEAQRVQAIRQMDGDLSRLYATWRERLLKCTAHVEAYVDFSEEEHIEDGVMDSARCQVQALQEEIMQHLTDNRRGERLRNGVHVAIIGKPNVGKSSLLNVICQRPAAIVSPIQGTTRDIVEVSMNLGGYPVVLSDTAGLRPTDDIVEREGVIRARVRAEQADIVLLVADASEVIRHCTGTDHHSFLRKHLNELMDKVKEDTCTSIPSHLNSFELNKVAHKGVSHEFSYGGSGDQAGCPTQVLTVLNKNDLVEHGQLEMEDEDVLPLSCVTQDGIERFLQSLTERVKIMCGNPSLGNPSLTQARHRHHLQLALSHLEKYLELENVDVVLAAEQLRRALWNIGKISGKVTSEELLDVIFRDFCIGK